MKSHTPTDTIGHYPIVSLLLQFCWSNSLVYRDLGSVLLKRIRNMFSKFLNTKVFEVQHESTGIVERLWQQPLIPARDAGQPLTGKAWKDRTDVVRYRSIFLW